MQKDITWLWGNLLENILGLPEDPIDSTPGLSHFLFPGLMCNMFFFWHRPKEFVFFEEKMGKRFKKSNPWSL